MQFDLKGHLNSTNLAVSKALWPLFEAVVNSIQSIEDSPNKSQGKITIHAEREPYVQNQFEQKEVLKPLICLLYFGCPGCGRCL